MVRNRLDHATDDKGAKPRDRQINVGSQAGTQIDDGIIVDVAKDQIAPKTEVERRACAIHAVGRRLRADCRKKAKGLETPASRSGAATRAGEPRPSPRAAESSTPSAAHSLVLFSRKALKNGVGKAERDGSVGQDGQKAERDEEKHGHPTSRRDHGRRCSATGWSRRLVITACAAHVSEAASRRLRISFSVFKISMEASRTRTSASSSRPGVARGLGAGMTTLQHVGVRPSGSDCSRIGMCGYVAVWTHRS
jgi:hypothetical protein